MVISLFTFSASLCKCHYSTLSDDDNNKQKEQKEEVRVYATLLSKGRERFTFQLLEKKESSEQKGQKQDCPSGECVVV